MASLILSRGLKRLCRFYSGDPLEYLKSLKFEGGFPKHIKESLMDHVDPVPEFQPREELPEFSMTVIEYNPESSQYESKVVNSLEYFLPRRTIVIGIIGAFVPECTCEVIHVWTQAAAVFKEKFYITDMTVVSRNDPYVMLHFAKKLDYQHRINFIADWDGKLIEHLECEDTLEELELGVRNHRYSGYIQEGIVKVVNCSAWNELFFTKSVHPIFMFKRMMSKKQRMLYFC